MKYVSDDKRIPFGTFCSIFYPPPYCSWGRHALFVILDGFFFSFFSSRKLNTTSWPCLKLVWDLRFVYHCYYHYIYYIILLLFSFRPVRIRFLLSSICLCLPGPPCEGPLWQRMFKIESCSISPHPRHRPTRSPRSFNPCFQLRLIPVPALQ